MIFSSHFSIKSSEERPSKGNLMKIKKDIWLPILTMLTLSKAKKETCRAFLFDFGCE